MLTHNAEGCGTQSPPPNRMAYSIEGGNMKSPQKANFGCAITGVHALLLKGAQLPFLEKTRSFRLEMKRLDIAVKIESSGCY